MHKYKYYFSYLISFILIFSFSIISYSAPDDSIFVWSSQSVPVKSIDTSASLNSDSDTDTSNSLNLTSGSACLIEQSTRKNFI